MGLRLDRAALERAIARQLVAGGAPAFYALFAQAIATGIFETIPSDGLDAVAAGDGISVSGTGTRTIAVDGTVSRSGHAHAATDITSGTLNDGRLSSNVPLKNAANTFTAAQAISGAFAIGSTSPATPYLSLVNTTPATGGLSQNGPAAFFETQVWSGSASIASRYNLSQAANAAIHSAPLRLLAYSPAAGWNTVVDFASIDGSYWTETVWGAPTRFSNTVGVTGTIGWSLTNSGGNSVVALLRKSGTDDTIVRSLTPGGAVWIQDYSGAAAPLYTDQFLSPSFSDVGLYFAASTLLRFPTDGEFRIENNGPEPMAICAAGIGDFTGAPLGCFGAKELALFAAGGAYYSLFSATATANRTITVPDTDGTLALEMPVVEVTGTSQTMVAGSEYIANNAGLVTLTLPATAARWTRIKIRGVGAGGWKVAQGASQQINDGAGHTTSGATGHADSANRYDALEIECVVADTTWIVAAKGGAPTFT